MAPKIKEGQRIVLNSENLDEDRSQVPTVPHLILLNDRSACAQNDESQSESESYDSDSCSELDMNGHQ